jgi:uncharacterized protein
MHRPRLLPLLLPALLGLAACGGPDSAAASPSPAAGSASAAPTVVVRAGRSGPVRAEVADTEQERAVGLMGRTAVPRGTGMLFRYDAPSSGRYYMFHVPVPLTAVFAREGRVVGVVVMPPCTLTEAAACPTYGPDVPFDTVLETAPETLSGLVAPGDRLQVQA